MPNQPRLQLQQTSDLLPLIKDSVFFKEMSHDELRQMVLGALVQQHSKGSFLFHEEERANRTYILVDGVIHLNQLTIKGQQVIMHYLSPGDEIGILSLFPDQIYPVTAVAATDCVTLSWSRKELSNLINKYPQLALNALQMMTERFVILQNQYRQLATERVAQRIARTILQIAEKSGQSVKNGIRLSPPPSRQQIAEMTGATLYTVSRICSQWEKDGLVHTNRRWLLIKKESALTKIVADGIDPL
ncbi:MAG: hypothetical protein CL608_28480 [Anaerolineaceae bacterium]|nr:hypothetical protein [Anaerolineaceae bacterium]